VLERERLKGPAAFLAGWEGLQAAHREKISADASAILIFMPGACQAGDFVLLAG
jgi:hypothetical protein